MDMLHDFLKITDPVPVSKSKPFDTSAVKLAEIYLPPGHFPVGFEITRSTGLHTVQKETDGKDLGIDHLLQRIKAFVILLVAYLKIRISNMIDSAKECKGKASVLLIIKNPQILP